MKKIAIILAGCGHQDGAEITESVSLLLSFSELGAEYQVFALNEEFPVQNHQTQTLDPNQKRNTLIESGRISRGKSKDLKELSSKDFDGLCFAGGFGVAKTLCNWATAQSKAELHPLVKKTISDFYNENKPIGAVCIAPVLLGLALGDKKVNLTLGNDLETAQEIEKTGAVHINCPVDDFITDRDCKVITTPAYMYDDAKPHLVYKGIRGLAKELVEMA